MAVSAADVKRLREMTGAGMMDCKKALEEADGDFDKAVEILRVHGAKGVTKRAERTASNGLVTSYIEGTQHGVLLELNCETDFVAKTPAFQQIAADVSAFVAAKQPSDVADRRRRVRPQQRTILEHRSARCAGSRSGAGHRATPADRPYDPGITEATAAGCAEPLPRGAAAGRRGGAARIG